MDEKNEVRLYGVMAYSHDKNGDVYSPIDELWEEVSPWLEKAIQQSDPEKYQLEDLYKALLDRAMQLWVVYDNKGLCAVQVTQIICYPRTKVLMLMFTSGRSVLTWLHLIENLKQFAIDQGCVSQEGNPNIEGFGREGWKKMSKHLGFEPISTVYKLTN